MIQETSIEALALAPNREAELLEAVKARREIGATDWEIHNILGCPYTSVQRPRGNLVAAGLLVKTEKRRLTAFGRKAIVWVAA
jgi:hypothetical protein